MGGTYPLSASQQRHLPALALDLFRSFAAERLNIPLKSENSGMCGPEKEPVERRWVGTLATYGSGKREMERGAWTSLIGQ